MPLFNNPILDFLLNPWFILSLTFWLVILALVYLLRNRKGAAYIFFPLLVMFRTKRLNKFIKKISKKAPKFWKVFWTIGIFISFSFIIYALYFFFTSFFGLIVDPKPEQAVMPLIPGVTINLPMFAYLILPLLFVVTTHEFAHGIAANVDGIDVKSTGVLGAGLFFIIGFGAFVEIDERELKSNKFKRNTRLRISAAGTFVNGITAGIAFVLILLFPLINAMWYRQVAQITYVQTKSERGFNFGNLANGDVILAIKKQGTLDKDYISLDNYEGRTLSKIISNGTSLKCSVGDNLTFRIYNPFSDVFLEKNITLGPDYNIGLSIKYHKKMTNFTITKIYSASEGGNNFNTNLTVGDVVKKVNGVSINQTNTLEYALTFIGLKNLTLSTDTENHTLNVDVTGVYIGIFSNFYFMYKNDVAKFLTSFWPIFWFTELSMLFMIAFSVTFFNMLPLPIFDGDRVVKELINWGIGEDYKSFKKKKDKFIFKNDEKNYELSEYRVDKINSIEIIMDDESKFTNSSRFTLAEDKYELFDKIGDGFKDTVSLNLPEQKKLPEGSRIEISYDHWYDEKRKIKRRILNSLRLFTFIVVLGTFILSFIKFGDLLFWI